MNLREKITKQVESQVLNQVLSQVRGQVISDIWNGDSLLNLNKINFT